MTENRSTSDQRRARSPRRRAAAGQSAANGSVRYRSPERSFASLAAGSVSRIVPTLGQVRAMAWFDGREPCSYLLDRKVNFVPEPMEFGYESELGQHALCFTCRDPYGRAMELVMMRDGGGFDLLGGF